MLINIREYLMITVHACMWSLAGYIGRAFRTCEGLAKWIQSLLRFGNRLHLLPWCWKCHSRSHQISVNFSFPNLLIFHALFYFIYLKKFGLFDLKSRDEPVVDYVKTIGLVHQLRGGSSRWSSWLFSWWLVLSIVSCLEVII